MQNIFRSKCMSIAFPNIFDIVILINVLENFYIIREMSLKAFKLVFSVCNTICFFDFLYLEA